MSGDSDKRNRPLRKGMPAFPLVLIYALLPCLLACGCGGNDAPPSPVLLSEITAEAGLVEKQRPWPRGTYQIPEISVGGLGLFDSDGDGTPEIYQVRYPGPGTPSEAAPNRLYRLAKTGVYREVAGADGLDDPGYGNGVAVGDIDNDGDLDVYVTNIGEDGLYLNEGGAFTRAPAAALASSDDWSSSASFLDYDRDGDLDLFVCHYLRDNPSRLCRASLEEKRDYCGPHKFEGVRDSLYRNEGNGRFIEVTAKAGISRTLPGFGVICFDLTGDGWVDIYVANDLKPNQLWVNRRDGTFTDEALARGLALNGAGKEEAGMGVALGDADGDGRLDLFITHLADQTHTLYAAAETGSGLTYRDRSASSGIGAKTLPMTGWGCGFLDLENDGDLDLVIAHGRVARGPVSPAADCGAFWNDYAESNQLFLNRGNGKYSLEKNRAGRFSSRAEVSRGIAFADIDNDGDTDLLQSNLGEGLRLFRNEAQGSGNHWLRVRALIGPRDDLGALVTLKTGNRTLRRPVLSSFSFACASEASVHFGLEKNRSIDAITVRWSDGSLESFTADGVDRLLVLSKGEGARKN